MSESIFWSLASDPTSDLVLARAVLGKLLFKSNLSMSTIIWLEK